MRTIAGLDSNVSSADYQTKLCDSASSRINRRCDVSKLKIGKHESRARGPPCSPSRYLCLSTCQRGRLRDIKICLRVAPQTEVALSAKEDEKIDADIVIRCTWSRVISGYDTESIYQQKP